MATTTRRLPFTFLPQSNANAPGLSVVETGSCDSGTVQYNTFVFRGTWSIWSSDGDLVDTKWTSDYRPRLRPLEAFSIQDGNDNSFGLRDPGGLSEAVLVLSQMALHIISLMDGARTCRNIRDTFQDDVGQALPTDALYTLLNHLEKARFLEGSGFDEFYAKKQDAFRHQAVRRPQRHSALDLLDGSGKFLEEMLARADRHTTSDPVVGLVAPHLDYPRGEPCYAKAYGTIKDRPVPDRIVVLGTNHFGRSKSIVATASDFETPLGITRTDVDFLKRVETRCGYLREYELDHIREHSIELQVAWLQYLFGPERIQIVPFLCPSPCRVDGTLSNGGEPVNMREFATILGELIDDDRQDTLIIAGADLSHIGAAFGDDRRLDDAYLEEARGYDIAALNHLVAGDPDAWSESIAKDDNPTHICSVGCIYVLATALPNAQAKILGYHQAVDQPSQTCVTCAAVAFT